MDEPAFDDRRPFTRKQLRAAGGDPKILRRRDYMQVLPQVWVLKEGIDQDTLVRAALLLHPPAAFASHLSAAAVLGLPVPEHAFAHVTVRRAADRRFRPRIKPHVTGRPRHVIVVRDIRTTDPIATFIDCAGWLGLVDLVILGDALVKQYGISAERLVRACKASTDYYASAALAAADMVREGVDSPMETRLRLLIVLAGLPEPTVNFRIYREDGTWKRRFDLCYPGIKLIIEYDGRQHAESIEQWHKDIERREEFDDEGYRILVVTARGVFREPARTVERVRRQLLLRGHPNVPSVDDRWQEYFAA